MNKENTYLLTWHSSKCF